MKKVTLLVIAGLFIAMAILFTTMYLSPFDLEKKDSFETIQKKGTFIVGLDDTFAPMGFKDEKGNTVGFDIDLAKAVAEKMGLKVEFKPCEWSGIIFELKSKNIDMIWNGMTITADRQKQINFSNAYIANRQIIITLANSNIKTKAELSNKKVGLQLGSSADSAVNSDSIAKEMKNIKKYDTNVEAMLDLESGRVDAVVMDEIVARYYIAKKEKKTGKTIYTVLNDNFGDEEYGVGIRKTDLKLQSELNKALKAITADGTAAKISKKWFAEDILLIK